MGFGTELVFVLVLGFLLLGPKKLPVIIRHIARVKAKLEHATHSLTTDLDAGLEPHSPQAERNFQERAGEQQ